MYESVARIRNPFPGPTTVFVEPWGVPLALERGETIVFEFEAETPGVPEALRSEAGLVVVAWPGASVRATRDGAEVFLSDPGAGPTRPSTPPPSSAR